MMGSMRGLGSSFAISPIASRRSSVETDELPSDGVVLARLEFIEAGRNHPGGQRVAEPLSLQLQEQTLLDGPRGYAGGSSDCTTLSALSTISTSILRAAADLLERARHVTVPVELVDDVLGYPDERLVLALHVKLVLQLVLERRHRHRDALVPLIIVVSREVLPVGVRVDVVEVVVPVEVLGCRLPSRPGRPPRPRPSRPPAR